MTNGLERVERPKILVEWYVALQVVMIRMIVPFEQRMFVSQELKFHNLKHVWDENGKELKNILPLVNFKMKEHETRSN